MAFSPIVSSFVFSGIGLVVLGLCLLLLVVALILLWRAKSRPHRAEDIARHDEALAREEDILKALDATLACFMSSIEALYAELELELELTRKQQERHRQSALRKAQYDFLRAGDPRFAELMQRGGFRGPMEDRQDLQKRLEQIARILGRQVLRRPDYVIPAAAHMVRDLLNRAKEEQSVLKKLSSSSWNAQVTE